MRTSKVSGMVLACLIFVILAGAWSQAEAQVVPPHGEWVSPPVVQGRALTPTSIEWTWSASLPATPAIKMFGYIVGDPDNTVAVTDLLAPTTTSFTEGNLQENTQYRRFVLPLWTADLYGFNRGTVYGGPESATVAKYTQVHDPMLNDFTVEYNPTSQGIRIVVTPPQNPTADQTGVEITCRDGNGAGTVIPFSNTYAPPDIVSLTPGATYYIRIQFRNGDGVTTLISYPKSVVVPSTPKGNCRIVRDGSLTDLRIDYNVTDFRETLNAPYALVSPEEIEESYGPALSYNRGEILKELLGEPASPGEFFASSITPASVFSACVPPTGWAWGRGDATLHVDNSDNLNPVVVFLQTQKNGKPLQARAGGTLNQSLEVKGKADKVLSFAGVYTLGTGGCFVRDHTSAEDAAAIKWLKGGLDEVLEILFLKEGLKRIMGDLFDRAFDHSLDLTCTAEYSGVVGFGRKTYPQTTGTILVTDLHDDNGNEIKRILTAGTWVKLSEFCEDPSPIRLSIQSEFKSTAEALGIKGKATALAGNFWAYTNLMCCENSETGITQRTAFSTRMDSAVMTIENRQQMVVSKLENIDKFVVVKSEIEKLYRERTRAAKEFLGWNDGSRAHIELSRLHEELDEMINHADD